MVKLGKKGVKLSPLFCDKLSFVIQYKTTAERDYVRHRLKHLKYDGQGHYAHDYGRAKYRLGMKFYVEQAERVDTMIIQADPKMYSDHFLRVEYKPVSADPGTVFWLLDQILPDGWSDIAAHAKCTRFDATVDVVGIDIPTLLAYYPGMLLSRLFCKGGRVETVDLGAYDGDKHVSLYDKRAEIKHWNAKHSIKKPIPTIPVTRIEIALRPSLTFEALVQISNPFAGLNIYTAPPVAEAETVLFQLFLKTAQLGGLQQALLALPEKERKQFKAIMEKSACSWWDPTAIWSAWPGLIAQILKVPTQTEPHALAVADAIF